MNPLAFYETPQRIAQLMADLCQSEGRFLDPCCGRGVLTEAITGNWYGRTLVKVDRFYPSSKTCSCCGHINSNLALSDRVWTCTACSATIDRDLNAAVNVHNRGLSDLSAESVDYRRGEFVSPVGSQGFDWPNSVKRLLDCRL